MDRQFVSRLVRLFVISIPLVAWAVEAGVALTPSHVLGLLLIVVAGVTWLRRRPPLPLEPALLSLLAFLVVGFVTVLRVQSEPDMLMIGESSHAKSIKQFVGLGFGVSIFAALVLLLRWYGLGLQALTVHYWTVAVFAVLTLVQYAVALIDIQSPLANFPVHNSTLGVLRPLSLMYGFPRVSLTLVEPSTLGTYLLSGWAFWLFALDQPPVEIQLRRRLFLASGVLLTSGVMITGSRLAYVVFFLLVFVALALRPQRLRRGLLVGVGIALGLMLTSPRQVGSLLATLVPKRPPARTSTIGVTPSGHQRTSSAGDTAAQRLEIAVTQVREAVATQDISVQHRTASYLIALTVLRERPLLGVGLGTSGFYMERYWPSTFSPLPPNRQSALTMLSQYATIATETGLLGAACVGVFGVTVFSRLIVLVRSSGRYHGSAWGVGAAIAAYALTGAVTALVVYQILLVWLMPAVALSLADPDTDTVAPPL